MPMPIPTVTDELWELLEPLLPVPQRRDRYPGRKRLDDRAVLGGILYVLHTGIAWEDLPQQLGYGSGMTCWRRLRDWNRAGVFDRLHQPLLARRGVRAERGDKTGASPVDRARAGSKHHLVCDAGGIPLAVSLTGGNVHDVTQLLPLVDAIGPVRGKRGRPRRRPAVLVADRGYDYDRYRRALRSRGIRPQIARRGQPHGSGVGRHRWVVERTIAWLHQFKRLRIRWEHRADIHEAFLKLACCLICWWSFS
jgi:transposase